MHKSLGEVSDASAPSAASVAFRQDSYRLAKGRLQRVVTKTYEFSLG